MIPIEHVLLFSSVLFALGLLGLMLHRNLLRVLLSIEAMFNGIAFGFVGVSRFYEQMDGQVMFLMILAVAAAEVSLALALVLNYDRLFGHTSIKGGAEV